jgi:hypothetical protein
MSDEIYTKRADELELEDVIFVHGVDIQPRLNFPFLRARVWKKETKKGKLYLYFETENNVFVKSKPLDGDEIFEFPPIKE